MLKYTEMTEYEIREGTVNKLYDHHSYWHAAKKSEKPEALCHTIKSVTMNHCDPPLRVFRWMNGVPEVESSYLASSWGL